MVLYEVSICFFARSSLTCKVSSYIYLRSHLAKKRGQHFSCFKVSPPEGPNVNLNANSALSDSPKTQQEDRDKESTKPLLRVTKIKCKECKIRSVQKHNMRTHLYLQQNLQTASKVSPPTWQNVNLDANNAILDSSKSTAWEHACKNNKTSV